jgi:hypothetical protein
MFLSPRKRAAYYRGVACSMHSREIRIPKSAYPVNQTEGSIWVFAGLRGSGQTVTYRIYDGIYRLDRPYQ